jgi:hypothetical protein
MAGKRPNWLARAISPKPIKLDRSPAPKQREPKCTCVPGQASAHCNKHWN